MGFYMDKKAKKHFQGLKKPRKCPRCGRKAKDIYLTDDGFWKIHCDCGGINPIYI